MNNKEKIFLSFQADYNPFKVIASMEKGIPIGVIDQICKETQFGRQQICDAVGLNTRTINRRDILKLDEADKLYRLVRVYALAVSVMENEQDAKQWLTTPKIALNHQVPLALLTTDIGTREVELLLNRIEHGVYS